MRVAPAHDRGTLAAPDSRCFGVRGASHAYVSALVLDDVDFELRAGEIHALVGENGSGKSTLLKILTGAVAPTAGTLYADDEEAIRLSSPAHAQRRGIDFVHQDYHLFPALTVAENVVGIGQRPPRRRWLRTVDKDRVDAEVQALLSDLGIAIPAHLLVGTLGPAERKLVEIARALARDAQFLILDEPTASLEPQTARAVVALMERLRERGLGVAFVSHRLDEVTAVADRVTVLRDGRHVATLHAHEGITEERLAELAIGDGALAREQHTHQPTPPERREDPPTLAVSGLELLPGRRPVSFRAERGEILGFTGLPGSGAARIVRMLGGAEPLSGRLEIDGRAQRIRTPRDAIALGIGFVPEDRTGVGLIGDQSVAVNIALASLGQVATHGLLRKRLMEERAEELRERLGIRTASIHANAGTLSGGNQQKLLLAKWLSSGMRTIVIEEPTHGIDIGAKAQVHRLLREYVADGGTIVLCSTDVAEIASLCDRIAVVRHGEVTGVARAGEVGSHDLAVMGTSDATAPAQTQTNERQESNGWTPSTAD